MALVREATLQRLALPEARVSWTRGLGEGEPCSLAIAPDAAWIAVGLGFAVVQLDPAGHVVARTALLGEPRGLAAIDGSRVAVAGFDGVASVLDVEAMRVKERTQLGTPLHAVCVAASGEIFLGGGDGRVFAWRPGQPARVVTKHPQAVVALASLEDGSVATACLAKSARVVGAQDGARLRLFDELGALPWCLATRTTSVAIGVGKAIAVYDVTSETPARSLRAHQGVVSALCWAADGTLWSGGEEGHVMAWRTDPGDARPRASPALDVSAKGRVIALSAVADALFVLRARAG